MRAKVEKICNHGCNVFFNHQLIYILPNSIFASKKIMAIEYADFDGVEQLAVVTGGNVVIGESSFDVFSFLFNFI